MPAPSSQSRALPILAALCAAALTFWVGKEFLTRPIDGGRGDEWRPSEKPEGVASRSAPDAPADGPRAGGFSTPAIARPRPLKPTAAGSADPVFFAIAGSVRDEAGEPVVDAEVELFFDLRLAAHLLSEAPTAGATKTDAIGAFRFERVDGAQRYGARITHPRFAPVELKGLAASSPGTLTREVVLLPGAIVEGTVRSGGAPVSGALVRIGDLSRPTPDGFGVVEGEARTDAEGKFRIERVPPGGKAVRLEARGYAPTQVGPVRIVLGRPPVTLELALLAGSPLRGRVVREGADGREPVAGATVRPKLLAPIPGSPPPPPGAAWPTTTTAADGSFAFEALPDSLYLFRVQAPGEGEMLAAPAPPPGAPADAPPPEARPGEGIAEIVLPRASGGVLRGRALDAETGRPLTRFFAWVTPFPDPFGAVADRRFFTGVDGTFEISGVRAGRWYVCVEPEGAPAACAGPTTVEAGRASSVVEVQATRGVVVRGRTVDERGKPLAGATIIPVPKYPDEDGLHRAQRPPSVPAGSTVHVPWGRATSAIDGSFELRVARGVWRLGVAHPDATPILTDAFACGADVGAGDLILRRAGILRGVVRDAAGLPDGAATISAAPDDAEGGAAVSASTDAEGRYEIRGLAPGGHWVRLIQREGSMTDGKPEGRPVRIYFGSGDVLTRDF